jgi:hypothetical protein
MLLPSLRLLAGIAVIELTHLGIACASYVLQDDYEGLDFFSMFNFITVRIVTLVEAVSHMLTKTCT